MRIAMRIANKLRPLLATAAASLSLLITHPAVAQTYEKIEGKTSEDVPAVPFVGLAYGFIWIAVLAYVVSLARNLAKTRAELEELRRKVDQATSAGPRR
jgi:CcmD family protein